MNVLVKGSIVEIDASPFVAWYEKHYGIFIGRKKVNKVAKAPQKGKVKKPVKPTKSTKPATTEKKEKTTTTATTTKAPAAKAPATKKDKAAKKAKKVKKASDHVLRKLAARRKARKLDAYLSDEFQNGRLLARISSRPGQCGRADGYILEGPEYEFYSKKVGKKRSK